MGLPRVGVKIRKTLVREGSKFAIFSRMEQEQRKGSHRLSKSPPPATSRDPSHPLSSSPNKCLLRKLSLLLPPIRPTWGWGGSFHPNPRSGGRGLPAHRLTVPY